MRFVRFFLIFDIAEAAFGAEKPSKPCRICFCRAFLYRFIEDWQSMRAAASNRTAYALLRRLHERSLSSRWQRFTIYI